MRERAYLPITRTVFFLMVLFSLGFLAQSIALLAARPTFLDLQLHFNSYFQWHQPLTHLFVTEGPWLSSLFHNLFLLLMLWSFGSELEANWGSLNFIKFVFLCILGGIVVPFSGSLILPGISVSGIGAIVGGVLVAFAIIWPDRKALFFFVLPMKMKWVILVLFVLTSMSGFPDSLLQQSGGALAASLFLYYHARNRSRPRVASESRLKEFFRRRKLMKTQTRINKRIEMKEEVDRLLDKISREGMQSLSKKEKSFLDRASREF